MTTITDVKDLLLEAIAKSLKADDFQYFEHLVGAYAALCQTETICKCPTRDDEGFADNIG